MSGFPGLKGASILTHFDRHDGGQDFSLSNFDITSCRVLRGVRDYSYIMGFLFFLSGGVVPKLRWGTHGYV